jgi:hypothetical protein
LLRLELSLALLACACLTDLLGGYLARRSGSASTLGAFPPWLPLVIIGMVAQFLLTSRSGRTRIRSHR